MRSAVATRSGLVGQVDLGIDAGFTGGALEGLGGRAQVARAVVDDGDAHQRSPSESDKTERRAGVAAATASARWHAKRSTARLRPASSALPAK